MTASVPLVIVIAGDGVSQAEEALRATAVQAAQHAGGEASIDIDVHRALDPVAMVSAVFGGINAAEVLWDWWHPAQSKTLQVTVTVAGGGRVDLRDVTSLEDLTQALGLGDALSRSRTEPAGNSTWTQGEARHGARAVRTEAAAPR